MPSTYTLNNGIELIATGEQSGTWGDTTNTNLSLVDTALDGQVTVTLPSAGTSGSPNTLPISDGAASDGRNRMVIFNDGGDLGATAYVQLTPNDAEKIIYVRNDLAGSRSIILFQGTYNASNDYELPAGTTAVIYFDGAGSGAVAANVFNNAYFDSLRLGSVSVTAILDEDDMSSDSATSLATQQSIKAYVDSQVTAQDLDFGGDSGTGAVDLDSQTFTIAGTANEIETSASGQTLTVGLPDDVTIAGDLTVDTDTLYVDSTNNRVGVGTSSPDTQFEISANDSAILRISSTRGGLAAGDTIGELEFYGNDGSTPGPGVKASIEAQTVSSLGDDSTLIFRTSDGTTNDIEAMRIDSSQRVLIGLDSSLAGNGNHSKLQIGGTSFEDSSATLYRFSNSAGSTHFIGYRSRSTTVGTFGTALQDNDNMLIVRAHGDDGTDVASIAADIQFSVDGAVGTNDLPGRITFNTTADGSAFTTERMRITSSGNVGIGVTNPEDFVSGGNNLVVGTGSGDQGISIYAGSSSDSTIFFVDSSSGTGAYRGQIRYRHDVDDMSFHTAGGFEAMRIDSSQRVLIGHTSSVAVGSSTESIFQVNDNDSFTSVARYSAGTGGPLLSFGKAKTNTIGGVTLVADGDSLGLIRFAGADGTDLQSAAAQITAKVDGTPGSNDMPGRLEFYTTADGASSPTERMRITTDGKVLISSTGGGTPGSQLQVLYNDSSTTHSAQGQVPNGLRMYNANTGTNVLTSISFAAPNAGTALASINMVNLNDFTASTTCLGDLTFSTKASGSSTQTERMRILSNGSVGIGQTSPVYSFHYSFADTSTSIGSGTDGNWGYNGIMVENTETGTGTKAILQLRAGTNDWWLASSKGAGSALGEFEIYHEEDKVYGINSDNSAQTVYRQFDGSGSNRVEETVNTSGRITEIINNNDGYHEYKVKDAAGNIFEYAFSGSATTGFAAIRPYSGASDGSINLGASNRRFQDLWLSGGMYVGGTGSSNYFDDYEEGSFTPTASDGTNSNAGGSGDGRYTKIGNRVYYTITFTPSFTGLTTAPAFQIGGLPFTASSDNDFYEVGGLRVTGSFNLTSGYTQIVSTVADLTNYIVFYEMGDSASSDGVAVSQATGIGSIRINGSYVV